MSRATMNAEQRNRLDTMQHMAASGIREVTRDRDAAVNAIAASLLVATELRDISTALRDMYAVLRATEGADEAMGPPETWEPRDFQCSACERRDCDGEHRSKQEAEAACWSDILYLGLDEDRHIYRGICPTCNAVLPNP